MPGLFITFEGGDGAGKSSQIRQLASQLTNAGHEVKLTREPGGSTGAEVLRHVLLSGAAEPFGPDTEVMLFAAARLDHMQETIRPALDENMIVLCDRFSDSTRAYQGGSGGIDDDFLDELEAVAVGDNRPDITFILDIPPEIGLARVNTRIQITEDGPVEVDRFEKDDLTVHEERRQAFLKIARNEPERCVVIDATQDPDLVNEEIWKTVYERLNQQPTSEQVIQI